MQVTCLFQMERIASVPKVLKPLAATKAAKLVSMMRPRLDKQGHILNICYRLFKKQILMLIIIARDYSTQRINYVLSTHTRPLPTTHESGVRIPFITYILYGWMDCLFWRNRMDAFLLTSTTTTTTARTYQNYIDDDPAAACAASSLRLIVSNMAANAASSYKVLASFPSPSFPAASAAPPHA
jgi:hypothetical protein